jgi:hypothetical protein
MICALGSDYEVEKVEDDKRTFSIEIKAIIL